MTTNYQSIKDYDPDLWKALKGELGRQEDHIELIASENFVIRKVLGFLNGTVAQDGEGLEHFANPSEKLYNHVES